VLDPVARRELAQAIEEEADHLNRLVHNLLEMTRLESGGIHVRKDWEPLEEVVGSALARVEKRLGQRGVDVRLPTDLPLVPLVLTAALAAATGRFLLALACRHLGGWIRGKTRLNLDLMRLRENTKYSAVMISSLRLRSWRRLISFLPP